MSGRYSGISGQSCYGRRRGPSSTLELHSSAVPQGLEGGSCNSGHRGCGSVAIPEQTWRGVPRSFDEVEKRAGHSTSWEMGSGQQRSNLRQAWPLAADHQQTRSQTSSFWGNSEVTIPGLFPRQESPLASGSGDAGAPAFQKKKFLSLFGGVGNPAKFFASVRVLLWI